MKRWKKKKENKKQETRTRTRRRGSFPLYNKNNNNEKETSFHFISFRLRSDSRTDDRPARRSQWLPPTTTLTPKPPYWRRKRGESCGSSITIRTVWDLFSWWMSLRLTLTDIFDTLIKTKQKFTQDRFSFETSSSGYYHSYSKHVLMLCSLKLLKSGQPKRLCKLTRWPSALWSPSHPNKLVTTSSCRTIQTPPTLQVTPNTR